MLADFIAMFWLMLLPFLWLMLLPLLMLADVIACLAEVIAMVLFVGGTNCVPIVADVIATFVVGRCYCHVLANIVAIVCLLVAPIVLLRLLLCHLWDYCILVADVVARLADVIAMLVAVFGRCYCQYG